MRAVNGFGRAVPVARLLENLDGDRLAGCSSTSAKQERQASERVKAKSRSGCDKAALRRVVQKWLTSDLAQSGQALVAAYVAAHGVRGHVLHGAVAGRHADKLGLGVLAVDPRVLEGGMREGGAGCG